MLTYKYVYIYLFSARRVMLSLYKLLQTERKSTPTPLLSRAKSFAPHGFIQQNNIIIRNIA